MAENDVQLIRRVLSGDDSAFSTLVQKHQKGVHALVWRKVGDFHHAEEITQDTFVQVYKKLGTLRDPNHFSGWLYVIANRLSLNWIQRHKPAMPSLEETPVVEIEESSYKHYISEKHKTEAAEHRSETVKQLLQTLPESERTVVTLHYLGEMTAKEIGKYLGVSVNTIKSRLRRGKERLKSSESMVSEMLGSVQLSADLTQRVMQQVADINPTAPPAGKPLIPWAALGTAVVVIAVMLGASNQYLARFQKPYSFEAQSQPTVEILDTPITLDIVIKPDTRRQFGQTAVTSQNTGATTQVAEATLRSNGQADRRNFSTTQWAQTGSPQGGHVRDIFATSEGNLYAFSSTGMYKLAPDTTRWTRVNAGIPIDESLMPTAENRGVLYIASTDEIFASSDNGETWQVFSERPKGSAIGFIITEAALEQSGRSDMRMYLALRDEGVFRSIDGGLQWDALDDGLMGKRVTAVAAVKNTVFVGTNRGLHRLDSGTWKQFPIGASDTVYSLAISGNNLYVGIGPDMHGPYEATLDKINRMASNNELSPAKIFHSDDLGASWSDITPKNGFRYPLESGIQVLAIGETLLALAKVQFRSTDGGRNWTNLGDDSHASMLNNIPSVTVNEKTFYKVGAFGIHRTTNAGESWDLFMNGVMESRIIDLVTLNNRLYAYNGISVSQSIDGGTSWKSVGISSEEVTPKSAKRFTAGPGFNFDSRLLVAGNILYFLSPSRTDLRISGLSTDGNVLIPIQEVPALESEPLPRGLIPHSDEARQIINAHFTENSIKPDTLTISGDVFYLEFRRTLFKWRLGDPTWTNTGLVDTPQGTDADKQNEFKLAVSGATVYVGKRDGKLFQSLDEGNSWKDVTPNLPLRFTHFTKIAFAGATVYVATDKGVLVSRNGEHWQTVRDKTNKRIVINQLAVGGSMAYGINDRGVYRLNTREQWEEIASEIPDEVTTLTVLNNRLYGVTQQQGLFHMLLEPIY